MNDNIDDEIEEFVEEMKNLDEEQEKEAIYICNDCDLVYPELPEKCSNELCGSKSFKRTFSREDYTPAERDRFEDPNIENDECEWCGKVKQSDNKKACKNCLEKLYQLRQNLKMWYREFFQPAAINLDNVPGEIHDTFESLKIALNNEIWRLEGELENSSEDICPFCGCAEFNLEEEDLICRECGEPLPENLDNFDKENLEEVKDNE